MADLLIKKIQIGNQAYSIYDERVQKPVPANAVFTDTTYTGVQGIQVTGTQIRHTNKVTAVSGQKLLKITYDDYGHITGSSAVTADDIRDLGVKITDNNTTYKLTIGTTTKGDVNGVDLGTLESKAATVDGTDLSLVTTGEKDAWNKKTSNKGTVTSVSGTQGLTLTGDNTTTPTLKANLNSYTPNSNAIGGKLYAVQLDKAGKLAVNVPWTDTDTKVTSVNNHYKTNGFTAKSSDLYKLTIDAAGHITGATTVTSTDIAKYITNATDNITTLQTLVNNIKAELEDPSAAGGLTTVLDTMQDILNSSATAVTGVTAAAYGTAPSLSVNSEGVLSLNPGTITGGTASSTKSFVTANKRVEPVTPKA